MRSFQHRGQLQLPASVRAPEKLTLRIPCGCFVSLATFKLRRCELSHVSRSPLAISQLQSSELFNQEFVGKDVNDGLV